MRVITAIFWGLVWGLGSGEVLGVEKLESGATGGYRLKRQSSFKAGGVGVRVPFWPIGWVHLDGVTVVEAPPVVPLEPFDAKGLRVTSVLIGSGVGGSLAVINGRAYGEGEYLKIGRVEGVEKGKVGVKAVRVRVVRIWDGGVELERGVERARIGIERPELRGKKTEEVLGDEER